MPEPSNLPPGVSDSMIPGNRPEDAAIERWSNDALNLYADTIAIWGPKSSEVRRLRDALVALGIEIEQFNSIDSEHQEKQDAQAARSAFNEIPDFDSQDDGTIGDPPGHYETPDDNDFI